MTYLRYVPGGCPGYYNPAHSLAETCQREHRVVGGRVYHVNPLPSTMWKEAQHRRVAAEKN